MFEGQSCSHGRSFTKYDHPLGLCLVAAGRGNTIPLKETFDLPDPTWLQFRRRFDKLAPFCRIASHTSEEVRDILATLETVYQQLFPQLNLRQWAGTIYTWLTHPVLDPTHSGRVTMDNLMKLVTTALEWSYLDGDTEVGAERLKSAAELLVLRHDTLKLTLYQPLYVLTPPDAASAMMACGEQVPTEGDNHAISTPSSDEDSHSRSGIRLRERECPAPSGSSSRSGIAVANSWL